MFQDIGEPQELPKVIDLIRSISVTDILQADVWLQQLSASISCAQGYYGCTLTFERVEFLIFDLSTLIGRTAKYSFDAMWDGHMFLDEVRQKAVALGVDVDVRGCHDGC